MALTSTQLELVTSDKAVCELREAEYWDAIDLLGRSFAGVSEEAPGEPVLSWLLPSLQYDNPHRQPYIGFLAAIDRIPHIKTGGGLLATRDASGNLAAIIHFYRMKSGPPGFWARMGANWRRMRAWIDLGARKRIPELLSNAKARETKAFGEKLKVELTARSKSLSNAPQDLHHKHAPDQHHYYVSLVAVEPSMQGQGHCGKLMRAINRISDAEGVSLFLDCEAENGKVYERMGYTRVATETVTFAPGDELTIIGMVRPAECEEKEKLS